MCNDGISKVMGHDEIFKVTGDDEIFKVTGLCGINRK